MIHTRERWSVRMHSGAIHVTDPIKFGTEPEDSTFAGPITKALNYVAGNYVEAYAFDRLDSIIAGTPVLLVVAHIESITKLDVQIEAPEDAFS